jgi:hypothetical protein
MRLGLDGLQGERSGALIPEAEGLAPEQELEGVIRKRPYEFF